ncbi:hypothetical protein, partial [Enterobacter hormaechei]
SKDRMINPNTISQRLSNEGKLNVRISLYSISNESIGYVKRQSIEFADLIFKISASHAGEM